MCIVDNNKHGHNTRSIVAHRFMGPYSCMHTCCGPERSGARKHTHTTALYQFHVEQRRRSAVSLPRPLASAGAERVAAWRGRPPGGTRSGGAPGASNLVPTAEAVAPPAMAFTPPRRLESHASTAESRCVLLIAFSDMWSRGFFSPALISTSCRQTGRRMSGDRWAEDEWRSVGG